MCTYTVLRVAVLRVALSAQILQLFGIMKDIVLNKESEKAAPDICWAFSFLADGGPTVQHVIDSGICPLLLPLLYQYVFIRPSVCLSVSIVHMFVCTIHMFVCILLYICLYAQYMFVCTIHTYVSIYVCMSVHLSVCLSVCLSFHLSGWLYVCMYICLSVCLSSWLYVCMFICLFD